MNKFTPKNIIIVYFHNHEIKSTILDPLDIACRDRNNHFDVHRTLSLIADCYDEIISINFQY